MLDVFIFSNTYYAFILMDSKVFSLCFDLVSHAWLTFPWSIVVMMKFESFVCENYFSTRV